MVKERRTLCLSDQDSVCTIFSEGGVVWKITYYDTYININANINISFMELNFSVSLNNRRKHDVFFIPFVINY